MNSCQLKSFSDIPLQQYQLPIFTIYKNPQDFKGKYVIRLFDSAQPTPYCIVKDTLEEVREVLPPGLTKIERSPEDDPVIAEVWI